MKELIELKTGDVFTIENTPSYPKLKIDGGYVDMRDEIVNKSGNCDNKSVEILSEGDLARQFETTKIQIKEWVNGLKNKYI